MKFYLTTIVGALILMIFAFYDGYPIVSNDTGTYIASGFSLIAPDDRPLFYGLFLRITSLGLSLWLSVFIQSLILSWLLIEFFRERIPGIRNAHIISLFILVSLGTIGGWYASQVMPDIFTSVLCLGILNYIGSNGKKQFVYLLVIVGAALMHNSHLIILTLFSILLLVVKFRSWRLQRKKAASLVICSGVAWIVICGSNYIQKGVFKPVKASHVFIMGKLVESGVLKTYLDKACPVYNYKICAYKDSLPPVAWEFVWDAPSPVHKTGGWAANEKEYNTIIHDIVTRPKYIPFLAYKSCEATLRQLCLINIDESYQLPWLTFLEGTTPYENIRQYYPHELSEFKVSKQNTKILDILFYDKIFLIVFLSSLLVTFFFWRRMDEPFKIAYLLVMLFIVINAFTTATFANVLTRLNSRVAWLLPMLNLTFLYKMLTGYLFHSKATGSE